MELTIFSGFITRIPWNSLLFMIYFKTLKMEMRKAENGHGIHPVLSLKSLCVNYHVHTKEVSQTSSSTCSWRAQIAGVALLDNSLWEEMCGKPWFQYSGEDCGSHYSQLAERSF